MFYLLDLLETISVTSELSRLQQPAFRALGPPKHRKMVCSLLSRLYFLLNNYLLGILVGLLQISLGEAAMHQELLWYVQSSWLIVIAIKILIQLYLTIAEVP